MNRLNSYWSCGAGAEIGTETRAGITWFCASCWSSLNRYQSGKSWETTSTWGSFIGAMLLDSEQVVEVCWIATKVGKSLEVVSLEQAGLTEQKILEEQDEQQEQEGQAILVGSVEELRIVMTRAFVLSCLATCTSESSCHHWLNEFGQRKMQGRIIFEDFSSLTEVPKM